MRLCDIRPGISGIIDNVLVGAFKNLDRTVAVQFLNNGADSQFICVVATDVGFTARPVELSDGKNRLDCRF